MTAYLNKLYIIKSNRESGGGRYDISIEPKDIKKTGIIIELKTAEENDDLEKLALEALKQIKKKEYKREMEHRKIKNIISLGIAFKRDDVVAKFD